jgi:hypothetical protein
MFGGEILISKKDSEWESFSTNKMLLGIPNKDDGDIKTANYRGIGLSDMVNSIINRTQARCSLELSLHILEIMEGILVASENSIQYETETTCLQPKPLSEKEIKEFKS